MTVYVVQLTNHNVAPAMEYGDIEVITRQNFPRFGGSDEHTTMMRGKLARFNINEDYLLIVGDPINIGYVMHILLKHGPIQVLKWDHLAAKYIPVVVK